MSKYKYFAAGESKDVVTFIDERCMSLVRKRGDYWELLRRNYHAYYSNNLFNAELSREDTSLKFRGERGELIKMSVNQARTLTKQFISIAVKQRLSFEALASTTDSEVLDAARLENAIIENMVDDKKIDVLADNAMETAFVLGAAFIAVTWDQGKGYPFSADPESGSMLMSGDVHFEVFTPFDVFYDYRVKHFKDLDWIVLRRRVNRADLIAMHPEAKEGLEKFTPEDEDSIETYIFDDHESDENMINVYEFYHKPTAAMPQGRLTVYCSKDVIIYDDVNPYECLPVSPIMPDAVIGTLLGYPAFCELLPAQEMLDSSYSTVASNQAAFGVQSVLVPKGSDLNVTDVGNLKFIHFTPQNAQGGGKPEGLNLTRTPPEIFQFADSLHKHLVELSGLNGALRGTPPPGVTSGVALSALVTNAVEFAQGASRAYSMGVEGAMLLAMKALKKFATVEQIVFMTGRNKETIAKKYINTDLRDVYKVRLRVSNPMAKTAGGRITMTEQMLANGLIKTPEDYFSVLMTGNIEQVMEGSLDEKSLVKAENDMLTGGDIPQALAFDNHARHILEHRTLLFNPMVRKQSEIASNVLTHILEHIELAKTTDPMILAIIATGQLPQGLPPGEAPQGQPPAAPEIGQEMAPPGEVTPLEASEELPGSAA